MLNGSDRSYRCRQFITPHSKFLIRTQRPLLSAEFVPVFFDDRIGQELFAHRLHQLVRLGFIRFIDVEFHVFADPHIPGILESQESSACSIAFP